MYYENPQGVSVHGGFPNPATDASLQGIDLNKLLVQNSVSTYLMRIAGNEWQALGIFAGDIIIVDRALGAHKTDLVIWVQGSDLAISTRHTVPKDAQVWGVVTSVIHQYRRQS
ncbi:MAG TPA: S24 family peptidase [Candidatus Limnocylindria bacterium]|nr:S24 family peptidase [Candidatus Limnocylindria bacterium]